MAQLSVLVPKKDGDMMDVWNVEDDSSIEIGPFQARSLAPGMFIAALRGLFRCWWGWHEQREAAYACLYAFNLQTQTVCRMNAWVEHVQLFPDARAGKHIRARVARVCLIGLHVRCMLTGIVRKTGVRLRACELNSHLLLHAQRQLPCGRITVTQL